MGVCPQTSIWPLFCFLVNTGQAFFPGTCYGSHNISPQVCNNIANKPSTKIFPYLSSGIFLGSENLTIESLTPELYSILIYFLSLCHTSKNYVRLKEFFTYTNINTLLILSFISPQWFIYNKCQYELFRYLHHSLLKESETLKEVLKWDISDTYLNALCFFKSKL